MIKRVQRVTKQVGERGWYRAKGLEKLYYVAVTKPKARDKGSLVSIYETKPYRSCGGANQPKLLSMYEYSKE